MAAGVSSWSASCSSNGLCSCCAAARNATAKTGRFAKHDPQPDQFSSLGWQGGSLTLSHSQIHCVWVTVLQIVSVAWARSGVWSRPSASFTQVTNSSASVRFSPKTKPSNPLPFRVGLESSV